MQVEFLDSELRAVAFGAHTPDTFSAGVAKALQAMVWSMESATSTRDVRAFRHLHVAKSDEEESVLFLSDEGGLSYRVEGDVVTVIGVLAPVRSA